MKADTSFSVHSFTELRDKGLQEFVTAFFTYLEELPSPYVFKGMTHMAIATCPPKRGVLAGCVGMFKPRPFKPSCSVVVRCRIVKKKEQKECYVNLTRLPDNQFAGRIADTNHSERPDHSYQMVAQRLAADVCSILDQ